MLKLLFNSPQGRAVILLLVFTGGASLLVGVFAGAAAWALPAQVLLALGWVVGTALVYAPEGGRLRVLAISAPAVGAVVLGLTVLPNYLWLLAGAGVGWVIAGLLLFRPQTNPEVRRAVQHLRKGRYDQAIEEMDDIIRRERDNPEHYRLRAMIFRLDDKLGRARRDYETMLSLASEDAARAEAYDGLAEVHLQAGRLEDAHDAALQAHELFPENWVPLYNLGLINDRLQRPQQVVNYLTRAFNVKIPDARQRLLAHLYLARAHARLGDAAASAEQIEQMQRLWKGLEGLEKLLSDDQSAPLSAVLAEDAILARQIMSGEVKQL